MNIIFLTGRVTHSPELKTTQSDIPCARFQIAVKRKYSSSEEKITDFIDCVAWRQTAEFFAKYIQKGELIALEGALQTRSYEDRDGNKKKIYEVIVDRIEGIGEKKTTSGAKDKEYYTDSELPQDDELPF